MNRQQQDLSWACLPKEARDNIRSTYFCIRESDAYYNNGYVGALLQIYGEHNLTSDTEPEEMLMVERKTIIERYHALKNPDDESYNQSLRNANILLLQTLFGDKCLPDKESGQSNLCDTCSNELKDSPDCLHFASCGIKSCSDFKSKEKPQPKFKVGDKVRIKPNAKDFHNGYENGYAWLDSRNKHLGKIYQVIGVGKDGSIALNTSETMWWSPIDLEPYTETETKEMEEKELNLCELLKGCEGEKFYSRAYGEVMLNEIVRDDRPNSQEIKVYTDDPQSDRVWFLRNGRKHKNGEIDLFPSRALYEKYPLDAKKAWDEWAEARKPKRWRAERDDEYWLIDSDGEPCTAHERFAYHNNANYNFGNYFRTEELAQQAVDGIREYLKTFHENISK